MTPHALPSSLYTHPARLVAIDGARRLNLLCVGSGEPAVIFEAGLGDRTTVWRFVQGQAGSVTRACSYDRAGYGFSDPPAGASDAAHTVRDLHALLAAAGFTKPVVLVGHSIGGLYATLYADRYPAQVAGMVLVDPSFAHQEAALTGDIGTAGRRRYAGYVEAEEAQLTACLALARSGALAAPSKAQAAKCLQRDPGPEHFDAALLHEFNVLKAKPVTIETVLSELHSFHADAKHADADSVELDAAQRNFGATPLVILTAGNLAHGAALPGFTKAQGLAFGRAWVVGHDRLAARSSRGSNTIVEGSGHYIEVDRPQRVIAAIQSVVSAVRAAP
jgi:pimeloyl-ACP methyl ester carboxylesterase